MTSWAAMPTTTGQRVTLACLWEATAAKPGNVHRGADFEDMTYADFVASAAVMGPVFDSVGQRSLGQLVLEAVQAMRGAVDSNTHLGTILLLAPLVIAEADPGGCLVLRAAELSAATTLEDCRDVYHAIRTASPSGMGEVEEADVSTDPDITLYQAMQLAADRDLVARQYINGFDDVAKLAKVIKSSLAGGLSLHDAIVHAHVWQMSHCPDSLIARKCGATVAQESSDRANEVLGAGTPGEVGYHRALGDLDFWLRADGNRRNPGTTADLIGAALYLLLAESRIAWPVRFYGAPDA